jgi:hypothetical protein
MERFEVDLLLRIDLRALIDPDGMMDTGSKKYLLQIQKYEQGYGFPRYYDRNSSHRYIRLADVVTNLTPYIQYCLDLDQADKFYCCQLQQALGVLNNDQLLVLMTTDSGVCYNIVVNYHAVYETILQGETDYLQANTFYGKVIDSNKLQIAYHPDWGNIDPDASENTIYLFDKEVFETQLKTTIEPVSRAFEHLNRALSHRLKNEESQAILDEVFPTDVSDQIDNLLRQFGSVDREHKL